MHCPYCRNTDSKVLDSRTAEDGGSIRRRRQCPACERRFTTVEQMQIVVVKRSGVVEPFNRDKVISDRIRRVPRITWVLVAVVVTVGYTLARNLV